MQRYFFNSEILIVHESTSPDSRKNYEIIKQLLLNNFSIKFNVTSFNIIFQCLQDTFS